MATTNSQTKPFKDQYRHCKDTGTCYDCGKKVGKSNLNGSAKCPTCYSNHLKYSQAKRVMRHKNSLCHYCGSSNIVKGLKHCLKCGDKMKAFRKGYSQKVKRQVFAHYGLHCECCGEDGIEFLTLDHIHGGGNDHRKELGKAGTAFYTWIIKNNFPKGFRTLCHNCNFGCSNNGGACPKASEHSHIRGIRETLRWNRTVGDIINTGNKSIKENQ